MEEHLHRAQDVLVAVQLLRGGLGLWVHGLVEAGIDP